MDKATKIAVEKYPHGKFDGKLGDSLRAACAIGYMQAEKDLALTSDDVKLIIELYWIVSNKKEFPTLGDVFQEVARRFNSQREKK